MSEKEQAKMIIDRLPDYKLPGLLLCLQGMQFSDELEDDQFCEKLYQDYLDDPDPTKSETISLEDLAAQEGVEL